MNLENDPHILQKFDLETQLRFQNVSAADRLAWLEGAMQLYWAAKAAREKQTQIFPPSSPT